MKKVFIIIGLLALGFAGTASALSSGVYRLDNVKRLDSDLYKDTYTGVVIKTRFCYHYTYGEEAILKWDGDYGYTKGKIIWDDDSSCDVADLY